MDWAIDFRFHTELHLSLIDIGEMDVERRIFYVGILIEKDKQEKKQMREMEKKTKSRSRGRR